MNLRIPNGDTLTRATENVGDGKPQHAPAPRLAGDPLELRCVCGSHAIAHVQKARRHWHRETLVWWNLCLACGRLGDYVPTRAEIADGCAEALAQRCGPLDTSIDFTFKDCAKTLGWCDRCRNNVELPCRLCAVEAAEKLQLPPLPQDLDEETAARLAMWIAELHVDVRLVNELEREGIFRVFELLNTPAEQLLQMRYFGPAAMNELREALAAIGFASPQHAGAQP